ncbi:hypothetical protein IAC76_05035 [Spirochaetes bacterium]|uniref:Uncharacterized protein n=1 Tax=Candidatus Scatousia excrementipullorum TaxID=2840936 RepID=A0A9D9H0R8_9BACT|nr:hypothetical protein [Candidatus Scatousia excrementipullorum]
MELKNKMNNEIVFISSQDAEEELFDMDSLLSAIDEKRSKTVSIIDADHPEDSQIYTYNKFLEIFDDSGLDGFIV